MFIVRRTSILRNFRNISTFQTHIEIEKLRNKISDKQNEIKDIEANIEKLKNRPNNIEMIHEFVKNHNQDRIARDIIKDGYSYVIDHDKTPNDMSILLLNNKDLREYVVEKLNEKYKNDNLYCDSTPWSIMIKTKKDSNPNKDYTVNIGGIVLVLVGVIIVVSVIDVIDRPRRYRK